MKVRWKIREMLEAISSAAVSLFSGIFPSTFPAPPPSRSSFTFNRWPLPIKTVKYYCPLLGWPRFSHEISTATKLWSLSVCLSLSHPACSRTVCLFRFICPCFCLCAFLKTRLHLIQWDCPWVVSVAWKVLLCIKFMKSVKKKMLERCICIF